jgi:hypothetical protein
MSKLSGEHESRYRWQEKVVPATSNPLDLGVPMGMGGAHLLMVQLKTLGVQSIVGIGGKGAWHCIAVTDRLPKGQRRGGIN